MCCNVDGGNGSPLQDVPIENMGMLGEKVQYQGGKCWPLAQNLGGAE